jgi:septation ring formation regulator EzrA
MADDPDDLTLRYLRSIDTKLDALQSDMREVKTRIGILEQQYASISNRVDRIETRLERIERRLDLVDMTPVAAAAAIVTPLPS